MALAQVETSKLVLSVRHRSTGGLGQSFQPADKDCHDWGGLSGAFGRQPHRRDDRFGREHPTSVHHRRPHIRRTFFFSETSTMPTMTQVRSILPDRLKRARFTTIAKDPPAGGISLRETIPHRSAPSSLTCTRQGTTQENSGIWNDKRDLADHTTPLHTEGRRSSMWHPNKTYGRRWWHESGDRQDWRDFRRGEKRISPDANASWRIVETTEANSDSSTVKPTRCTTPFGTQNTSFRRWSAICPVRRMASDSSSSLATSSSHCRSKSTRTSSRSSTFGYAIDGLLEFGRGHASPVGEDA